MDAFFASVEQRDNPELLGKPIAVGGSRERGVVAAASYEARKFGVRSAMSSKIAAQKCPELIFVKPNFEKYKQASQIVMAIFKQYTDLVEPLSLDEAYLDVTENKMGIILATEIAQKIKAQIHVETGLTASAGVSYCKFLAKIASGYQKPNGITIITPNKAEGFIEKLNIGDFFGIGKVTAEKMNHLGIYTGKDLKQLTQEKCIDLFGIKHGNYYYHIARGIDDRAVQPNRIRKSIGSEETFESDIEDIVLMQERIIDIATDVAIRCHKAGFKAKTLTLKIKYNDFTITTRSKTHLNFIATKEEITTTAIELLFHPHIPLKPVRLFGISMHKLDTQTATKTIHNGNHLQLTLSLG